MPSASRLKPEEIEEIFRRQPAIEHDLLEFAANSY